MKKKINETQNPFIKHLENKKGYTIDKDTDMDGLIGVTTDYGGIYAILLENDRVTFRTAHPVLKKMKDNRYNLLEYINTLNNQSMTKFMLMEFDDDNIWLELSYLQKYDKDAFDFFLDKMTVVLLTNIENFENDDYYNSDLDTDNESSSEKCDCSIIIEKLMKCKKCSNIVKNIRIPTPIIIVSVVLYPLGELLFFILALLY